MYNLRNMYVKYIQYIHIYKYLDDYKKLKIKLDETKHNSDYDTNL